VAIRLANRALFLALILAAISVIGSVPTAGQVTGLKPQSRRIETFPEVDDLKSVVIFLSHTGGAFSFPCNYSLRIAGEGIVEYHGKGGYHVTGPHRGWITGEEMLKLVESFREADFYSLEDESQMVVMDAGSTAISLTIGNRTRRVVNRIGESHRFKQLAAKIEQLSHAEKWLVGNAETVPSLLADMDNLNVPDDEGGTVLMWACQRTDAAVVRKFLAAGANLHARDRYGRTALTYAVARGMPEAVDVLLQAGADAKESDQEGETPLTYAAGIRDVWFGRWFSAPGDSSSRSGIVLSYELRWPWSRRRFKLNSLTVGLVAF
jgi:hypothetical protein